ncbi:MAG TPA: glycosyltransferase family 2 protein [bacterium]|nr:glycosyltransferase family 2 protein [bacterium]
MRKLSVVIAALNEEKNIGRALKSASFADDIVIVDSGSTDNTVKAAKKYTSRIYRAEFRGFSAVKGMGTAKAKGDYILVLDADEEITAALKNKIKAILGEKKPFDGYAVKRVNFFLGGEIKYCGWGNDYQVRLFKNGAGRFDGRQVHENIIVRGLMGKIEEPLLHYTYPDSSSYFIKMNRYTTLAARPGRGPAAVVGMVFAPFLKFFRMFFLKRGFKDGMRGFILCVYSGISEFVKYAKEAEKGFKHGR